MALVILENKEQVAKELVACVSKRARDAIVHHGYFTVAISGGSLPSLLQGLLESQVEWDKWKIFYADERCVPIDSAESNHKACVDEFLGEVVSMGFKPEVHCIDPALPNTDEIAKKYAAEICAVVEKADNGLPSFDMVLLGMGPDGHTASLFPGHPLALERGLGEQARVMAPIDDSPKPPSSRVTLTADMLNNAQAVIFVVTGQGKATVLSELFTPTETEGEFALRDEDFKYPAGNVRPRLNQEQEATTAPPLTWIVDQSAASILVEQSS